MGAKSILLISCVLALTYSTIQFATITKSKQAEFGSRVTPPTQKFQNSSIATIPQNKTGSELPVNSNAPTNEEKYTVVVKQTGWANLSSKELRLSFEYPLTKDQKVEFYTVEYTGKNSDPIGQTFDWSVNNEAIATGFSKDHLLGRQEIDTTAYRWTEQSDKYYIVTGEPELDVKTNAYIFTDKLNEVKPIKTYITNFNTHGLLYTNTRCFNMGEEEKCIGGDRSLIINLPETHHKKIKSIIIYLNNDMTEKDIVHIVDSINLLK